MIAPSSVLVDLCDTQKLTVGEKETEYINFYRHDECPVQPGIEWDDNWTAMCDDECPGCGAAISPYRSEDAETGEEVV